MLEIHLGGQLGVPHADHVLEVEQAVAAVVVLGQVQHATRHLPGWLHHPAHGDALDELVECEDQVGDLVV